MSGIVLAVSVHVYAQARGKRENVENADRVCVFFVCVCFFLCCELKILSDMGCRERVLENNVIRC